MSRIKSSGRVEMSVKLVKSGSISAVSGDREQIASHFKSVEFQSTVSLIAIDPVNRFNSSIIRLIHVELSVS